VAPGAAGGGQRHWQAAELLALDEAHKFMNGVAADGLSEAVVNVARLMRHDGLRLAVSTQSPAALAPELLKLITVAVLHRFHSRDWSGPPADLCYDVVCSRNGSILQWPSWVETGTRSRFRKRI
jgi:hypothetical protein